MITLLSLSLVQIFFQFAFIYFRFFKYTGLPSGKKPLKFCIFFLVFKTHIFSYFIALSGSSKTMLNNNNNGGNPFLTRIKFKKQKYSISRYENLKDCCFILLNCHLKIFLANLTLTSSIQKYLSNSLSYILHPIIARNESDNLKNGFDVEETIKKWSHFGQSGLSF